MDDFLIRAVAGGIGMALITGPLGCFVVWRRMAYFGETISHAALLGIALGLVLNVSPIAGVVAVSVAVALLLALLQRGKTYASDTLLGILAHGTLAVGLVVIAMMETVRVDLLAFLFGDILAISAGDVLWIYAAALAVAGVLVFLWRPLVAISVHEDLAFVEGVPVAAAKLALMILLAMVVAVAMKVVGILLVISLLIIPAATARTFAETPEHMAVLAAVAGVIAVCGGLWGSLALDTPAGPSIVVASFALFLACFALPRAKRFLQRAGAA
ncbi:MAG: hypothetical protein EXQ86_02300 [Rhodospirillales bacterium]|nr:hypothetical protein [Rhodospirillales bacterium]